MGWDPSKISRYERGTGLLPREVLRLLEYYGVDTVLHTRLRHLSIECQKPDWWDIDKDDLKPWDSLEIGSEQSADRILYWSLANVPDLLRTEAYDRAVTIRLGMNYTPPSQVRRHSHRLALRQTFLDSERAPTVNAVLDEAVIHRLSYGPTSFQGQLDRLCSPHPSVTIQVVPLDSIRPNGASSFAAYFTGDTGIAVIRNIAGAQVIQDERRVWMHQVMFAALSQAALSSADSAALIKRIAG